MRISKEDSEPGVKERLGAFTARFIPSHQLYPSSSVVDFTSRIKTLGGIG